MSDKYVVLHSVISSGQVKGQIASADAIGDKDVVQRFLDIGAIRACTTEEAKLSSVTLSDMRPSIPLEIELTNTKASLAEARARVDKMAFEIAELKGKLESAVAAGVAAAKLAVKK